MEPSKIICLNSSTFGSVATEDDRKIRELRDFLISKIQNPQHIQELDGNKHQEHAVAIPENIQSNTLTLRML